ncbi:MAG: DNA recombination protein RmuC [Ruminococcaceae bacterium]|nr:DNA recombination protein RmuC [Oscillospiraceae bacterium]
MEIVIIILGSVAVLLLILLLLRRPSSRDMSANDIQAISNIISEQNRNTITAMQLSLNTLTESMTQTQRQLVDVQDKRLNDFSERISRLTQQNKESLDKMRDTVDEKLQKTLEERIARSFATVNERLEQVYKGLGEMQTLATGVGDLKKVLSNVKTRGILGEIQLGSILSDILSPEQYCENISTKPGSADRVEFAVVLPGSGDGEVYLPIDAKFPADIYAQLMEAYDSGDATLIKSQSALFERRLCDFAKDIKTKYVYPPATTDFAIMFLPTEGLYAEAIRHGMIERLQREYKVNIAGPTTMAALLNSLQTGFRTLAIQKRSSEVWEVLGAVKTEFENFETVLQKAQEKITSANSELDKLIGTRTRAINRKLKNVTQISADVAKNLLEE